MIKKISLYLIAFYQKAIRPFIGPCCRFVPSCSEYSKEAIVKYGAVKGCFLTLKRLLKCHPFHPGGHDPLK